MILFKQKNRLFSLFQTLFVRPSRNRRKFFVLGALVLVLILFFPRPAHAGAIGEAVIAILWAVIFVCKLFVSLAATTLAFMLRGDIYYFANEPMILVGWKICRDLCNLFFLLILIFIAFCTILQIEKYHAKKTLLTLIIMALLINFSKPIAIFIFDGSQLLMNYFIGNTDNFTTTIGSLSRVADIVYKGLPNFWERWNYGASIIGWGGVDDGKMVSMQITVIIFTFMYAVALFVMAVYLFIRLVALWILIIVSPFAFLLAVVPDFKKYSDEWWSALFKYCYTGPILAFFLYLSTKLAESKFLELADKDKATQIEQIISLGNFVHFIVVIVFLYASIIMAQKFGIAFAGGITSGANKALKMGTGLTAAKWGGRKAWQGTKYAAKGAAKWGERKYLEPMGISPRALWQGWKQGAEEADREIMEPAAAKARDMFNEALGRKKPEGYHENVQFELDVDKYMKEQKNISTEDKALIAVLQKFKGDKSPEAQKRVAAALRLMFENNDQNEFMKQFALVDEDFAKLKLKSNNPEDLRKALTHVLGNGADPSEMSADQQNQVGRQLHQLGNIALSKGNLGNYGMASFDEQAGKYVINDGSEYTAKDGTRKKREQIPYARAKAQNIDVQEKMKRMHWNAILEENADSTPGGVHATGMVLLADMRQAEIGQLNRTRPDFVKNLYEQRAEVLKFANNSDWKDPRTGAGLSEEQRNNLKNFVKGIEKQFRGENEKGKQAGKKTGNKWGREPRARSK